MAPDTESCAAEESDNEVYVDAEKTYSGVHLVPKWKTKAFVWKYFCFEADKMAVLFVSIYQSLCPSHTTAAAKDSNAFNLYSHLKTKHSQEYNLACQASKKKRKASSRTEKAVLCLLSWTHGKSSDLSHLGLENYQCCYLLFVW